MNPSDSNPSTETMQQWLELARSGDSEFLGRLMEVCRVYLTSIAREEMGDDLQARCGPSDVVQETFLEAQQDFAAFQGHSPGELMAWLRRILWNNLHNMRRYHDAACRQVSRDRSEPSEEATMEVPTDDPSPSSAAIRNENIDALQRAIERLPPHYARVLQLRYRDQLTFEMIAERMASTPDAVRKLWGRAFEAIRDELRGLE